MVYHTMTSTCHSQLCTKYEVSSFTNRFTDPKDDKASSKSQNKVVLFWVVKVTNVTETVR